MGKLLASAAVRDITPSSEICRMFKELGGKYSAFGYDGVHVNLYLRLLVLSDGENRFCYFATDSSYFNVNKDMYALLEEFGIKTKDCCFSGTRCHNGAPMREGGAIEDMPTEPERLYATIVLKAMRELLNECLNKLVPARIGGTVGTSNINTYREQYTAVGNFETMNHNGPRAPWLRVCRVETLEHKTIALLVNYCMQNCSLYWNTHYGEFNMVSSDVAGQIINWLECAGKKEYPVFWSVGGGADQQAVTYSLMDKMEVDENGKFYYVHDYMPLDANLKLMRFYACEQGQDVLRAVSEIDNYSDEFNYYSDEVYVDVPRRESLGHPPMVFDPKKDNIKPTLADEPVRLRFSMAMINDIAFCGVNARTFSEIYKLVADMMPARVTMFFDDCYGTVSGICPPRYEEQGMNCHASLQSETYTMRMGYNALLNGYGKLLEKYMLKTVHVYCGAEYPEH